MTDETVDTKQNQSKRMPIQEEAGLLPKSKIKELREAAAPPGKRPSWLNQLSDRRLAEVYLRLKDRQKVSHICRIVQNEWGIMRTSEVRSMARSLQNFKDKVISELKQEVKPTNEIRKQQSATEQKRAKRIKERLDSLGSWRWLIDVQAQRVELAFNREKQVGMNLKQTEETIKTLGELLDKYVNRLIQLGILDAQPSDWNMDLRQKFEALTGKMIKTDGSEIIKATSTFLERAEKEAETVDYQRDESGVYRPAEVADGNDAGTE